MISRWCGHKISRDFSSTRNKIKNFLLRCVMLLFLVDLTQWSESGLERISLLYTIYCLSSRYSESIKLVFCCCCCCCCWLSIIITYAKYLFANLDSIAHTTKKNNNRKVNEVASYLKVIIWSLVMKKKMVTGRLDIFKI